ncbi:hypothetical protein ACOME3_009966 [Neoechinorhynchus agilis]
MDPRSTHDRSPPVPLRRSSININCRERRPRSLALDNKEFQSDYQRRSYCEEETYCKKRVNSDYYSAQSNIRREREDQKIEGHHIAHSQDVLDRYSFGNLPIIRCDVSPCYRSLSLSPSVFATTINASQRCQQRHGKPVNHHVIPSVQQQYYHHRSDCNQRYNRMDTVKPINDRPSYHRHHSNFSERQPGVCDRSHPIESNAWNEPDMHRFSSLPCLSGGVDTWPSNITSITTRSIILSGNNNNNTNNYESDIGGGSEQKTYRTDLSSRSKQHVYAHSVDEDDRRSEYEVYRRNRRKFHKRKIHLIVQGAEKNRQQGYTSLTAPQETMTTTLKTTSSGTPRLPARSVMSMAFEDGSDVVIRSPSGRDRLVRISKVPQNVPTAACLSIIGNARLIKDLDTGKFYTLADALSKSLLDAKRKCLVSKKREDVYLTQESSGIDREIGSLLSREGGFYAHPFDERPISILEAIDSGILDLTDGCLVNFSTGEKVSITDGYSLGLIDDSGLDLLNKLASQLIKISKKTSEFNIPINQVGKRILESIDDSVKIESIRSNANLSLCDAIRLDLIDRRTNQFIRPCDGQRISIREAIQSGYLASNIAEIIWKGKRLDLNETIYQNILDGETGYICSSDKEHITLHAAIARGIFEKPMTISELILNGLIDEERFPLIVYSEQHKQWITFEEAVQNGLVDRTTRCMIHPINRTAISLDEATKDGLIQTNGKAVIMPNRIAAQNITDAVKSNQLQLILRKPALKGHIIRDVLDKRAISLGEAVNRSIINLHTQTFTDTSTSQVYSIDEAIERGNVSIDLKTRLGRQVRLRDYSGELKSMSLLEAAQKGLIDLVKGSIYDRNGSVMCIPRAMRCGLLDEESERAICELRGELGYDDYIVVFKGDEHRTSNKSATTASYKGSDFTLTNFSETHTSSGVQRGEEPIAAAAQPCPIDAAAAVSEGNKEGQENASNPVCFLHRSHQEVQSSRIDIAANKMIMHERDNTRKSTVHHGSGTIEAYEDDGSSSSLSGRRRQQRCYYVMPAADVAEAGGAVDMGTNEESSVASDRRANVSKCTHIDGGWKGAGFPSSTERAISGAANVRRQQLSFIEAVNEQLLNIKTGYVNVPVSYPDPLNNSSFASSTPSADLKQTTVTAAAPAAVALHTSSDLDGSHSSIIGDTVKVTASQPDRHTTRRTEVIDLREAIERGIINPDSAYVIHPQSKQSLNLLEAINRNIISICGSSICDSTTTTANPNHEDDQRSTTDNNATVLPKRPNQYTISQAIKAGILKIGNPKLHSTSDSMISKTESFSVKSVRDARTNEFISPNKAIKLKILDPYQGAYYDTCTNRKYTIDEAISQGEILVEKIFDSSISRPETRREDAYHDSECRDRNVISTSLIREIRSYHLLGVIDPVTRTEMTVHNAISSGILDRKKGRLYNGLTHEWLSISDAINQGFIQARIMPIDDNTDPRLLLSRRAVSETKTFALKGAVDTRTDKIISIRNAIEMGIIDQATGLYRNLLTNETMPISLAVEKGLIITEESVSFPSRRIEHGPTYITKDTRVLCIEAVIDPVSRSRMTVNEAFKRGLIDSINCSFYNTLTNKVISLTDAYMLGYIIGHYVSDDSSSRNLSGLFARVTREERSYLITSVLDTRSDRKIDLSDAIDKGLFDREKAVYVNPLTNQETNLKDAIAQGYVQATVVTGAPDHRSPCSTKVVRIQESSGDDMVTPTATWVATTSSTSSINRTYKVDTVEEYIEPIKNLIEQSGEDRYHKVVHKERNVRERDVLIETNYADQHRDAGNLQSGVRNLRKGEVEEIIIDDHNVAESVNIESETRSVALKHVTIEDDSVHPRGNVIVIEERHQTPIKTMTTSKVHHFVGESGHGRQEPIDYDLGHFEQAKTSVEVERPVVMLSVDDRTKKSEKEKDAQRKERELFINEVLTKAKEYKDASQSSTTNEAWTEKRSETTSFSIVHDGMHYTLTWLLEPDTNEKVGLRKGMDLGLFDTKTMRYYHTVERRHYTAYEAIKLGYLGTDEDVSPLVVTFDNIEYTIEWVLDPTEKCKIFPRLAVQKGILDVDKRRYFNPYNNVSINLHEAVKMKFIGATEKLPESDVITVTVGEHEVHFNWVIDTINRDRVSAYDALKRGIVDIQKGIYFKFDTGDIMTLFDAFNAGFIGFMEDRHSSMSSPLAGSLASLDEDELTITTRTATYVITSVVNPVDQQEIKVCDAIELGIIDKSTGSYHDMTTGITYELADAINEGLVYASVIETMESTEMETSSVKNVVERFIVKTVIDPRDGKRIGGLLAQANGILNYAQGMYSDPDSGRCISIREAIDRNLIEVQLIKQTSDEQFRLSICTDSFTLRRVTVYTIHSVRDPVLDEDIPAHEAVHRQIIDSDTKKYFNASNGQYIELREAMNLGFIRADVKESVTRKPLRLSLQNATRLGFYNYSTGTFRDPYSQQSMTLQEAIDKGHIHLSSPACASSIQGPIVLRAALNMGLISRSTGMLDASKAEKYKVILFDSKIYRMNFEDAVRCGLLDLSTCLYKHLHTGEKLTLKEAIGRGLLNGESTTVQHPTTFSFKSLADAVNDGDLTEQGMIVDTKTGEIISNIEREFNQRRIFSNFDVNSGEVFIRSTGERLSFEKAARKGKLDSHYKIIDFKSGREFNIQEAFEHGIIDSETGRVYNYIDGGNMSIREAIRRGFIALSDSTVVPMKADQGALAVQITSKKRRRSSRTKSGGGSTNLSTSEDHYLAEKQLYKSRLAGDVCDSGSHRYIKSSSSDNEDLDDALLGADLLQPQQIHLCLGCSNSNFNSFASYKTQCFNPITNHFTTIVLQSVFDPVTCRRVSVQQAVDSGSFDPVTGVFIDKNPHGNADALRLIEFDRACALGLVTQRDSPHCRINIVSVQHPLTNESIDLQTAIKHNIIDYGTGSYMFNPGHEFNAISIDQAIQTRLIEIAECQEIPVDTIEEVWYRDIKMDKVASVTSDSKEYSVDEALEKRLIENDLYVDPKTGCRLSLCAAAKNGLITTLVRRSHHTGSFLTNTTESTETHSDMSLSTQSMEIENQRKSNKPNLFKKLRDKLKRHRKSADNSKLENHLYTRNAKGVISSIMSQIDNRDLLFSVSATDKRVRVEDAIKEGYVFPYNPKLNAVEGFRLNPENGSISIFNFTSNSRKHNVMWIGKAERVMVDGIPLTVSDAVTANIINVMTFDLPDWMRTTKETCESKPEEVRTIDVDDISQYLLFFNRADAENMTLLQAIDKQYINVAMNLMLDTLERKWITVADALNLVLRTSSQSVILSHTTDKSFIIDLPEKRITFHEDDLFDRLYLMATRARSLPSTERGHPDRISTHENIDRTFSVTSLSEILNDIIAESTRIPPPTTNFELQEETKTVMDVDSLENSKDHHSDESLDYSDIDPDNVDRTLASEVKSEENEDSLKDHDAPHIENHLLNEDCELSEHSSVRDESKSITRCDQSANRSRSWEAKVQLNGVLLQLNEFRTDMESYEMLIIRNRCPSLIELSEAITSLSELSASIEKKHEECALYLLERRRDNWFCSLTEEISQIDSFEADINQRFEKMKTEVYARQNLLEHAAKSSQNYGDALDKVEKVIMETNSALDSFNDTCLSTLNSRCNELKQLSSVLAEHCYANLDNMSNSLKNIEDDLLAVYDRATVFATNAGDFSEAAVQIVPDTAELKLAHSETQSRVEQGINHLHDISELLSSVDEKHALLLSRANDLSSSFQKICANAILRSENQGGQPECRQSLQNLRMHFLSHSEHLTDINESAGALVELLISNPKIFRRSQADELHQAVTKLVNEYRQAIQSLQSIDESALDDTSKSLYEDESDADHRMECSSDVMTEFSKLTEIIRTSTTAIEDLKENISSEENAKFQQIKRDLAAMINDALAHECDHVIDVDDNKIKDIRECCQSIQMDVDEVDKLIEDLLSIKDHIKKQSILKDQYICLFRNIEDSLRDLSEFVTSSLPSAHTISDYEIEVENSQEKLSEHKIIGERLDEMYTVIATINERQDTISSEISELCSRLQVDESPRSSLNIISEEADYSVKYDELRKSYDQLRNHLSARAGNVEGLLRGLHSYTNSSHSAWKLVAECQTTIDSFELIDGFPVSLKVLSDLEDELIKLRRRTIDDGWMIDACRDHFIRLYPSNGVSSSVLEEEKRVEQLVQKWTDLGHFIEEAIIDIRDQMVLIQALDEVYESVYDDLSNRSNLLNMLSFSSSDSSVLALSLQSALDLQNDHNDGYCLVTHVYSLLERIQARAEKDGDDGGLEAKCSQLGNDWMDLESKIATAIDAIKQTQLVVDQFNQKINIANEILDQIDEETKSCIDKHNNARPHNEDEFVANVEEVESVIWRCRELASKAADLSNVQNLSEELDSSILATMQRLDRCKLVIASVEQSKCRWKLVHGQDKPDFILALDKLLAFMAEHISNGTDDDSTVCKEAAAEVNKQYPGLVEEFVDWPMRHDKEAQRTALQLLFNLTKAILRQRSLVDNLACLTSKPNRDDDEVTEINRLKVKISQHRLYKTDDVLTVIHRATLSKLELVDKINEIELGCQRVLMDSDGSIEYDIGEDNKLSKCQLEEISQNPNRLAKLLEGCQQLMHKFRSTPGSYEIILNNHILITIIMRNSEDVRKDMSLYVSEFKELERDCLCRLSNEHEIRVSAVDVESVLISKTHYIRKLVSDIKTQITDDTTCNELLYLLQNLERISLSIEYTNKSFSPVLKSTSEARDAESCLDQLWTDVQRCKEIIGKRLSPHQIRRIDNARTLFDEALMLYSDSVNTLDKYSSLESVLKPKQLEFQVDELGRALMVVRKSQSIIKQIRVEVVALEKFAIDCDRIDQIVSKVGDLEKDQGKVAAKLTEKINQIKHEIHPRAKTFWDDLCSLRNELTAAQTKLYEACQSSCCNREKCDHEMIDILILKQRAITEIVDDLKNLESMVKLQSSRQNLIDVVHKCCDLYDENECCEEINSLFDEVNQRHSVLLMEATQYAEMVACCIEESKEIHREIVDVCDWLSKLEAKFTRLKNTDLSESDQVLLSDLNDCYECIDEATAKRASIRNIGSKLHDMEDDTLWRGVIKSVDGSSKKLENECDDLLSLSIDKASSIENELVTRNCDQALADNLYEWLSDMIDKISAREKDVIPLVCAGIETRKACFEAIHAQHHLKLEILWNKLKKEVSEQALSVRTHKQPNESIMRLLAWIKSMETMFSLRSTDLSLAGSYKILQKQYNKFMVTYNDILLHEEDVTQQISQQCDRLSSESSTNMQHDKYRLMIIQSKWELVKERAMKRKETLENALKDASKFNDELQLLTVSLGDLEHRLNQIGSSNRNRDSLVLQQSLHDDFLDSVARARAQLVSVEKLGTKIRFYCRPSDAIMIRNLLFAMKRRYDKVISRSSEKRRAIDRLLKEVERFHSIYDNLNEWMTTVIEVLDTNDVLSTDLHEDGSNDRKYHQKTLDEHKLLMREIELNRPVFDQVLRQCNRWISTSNTSEEKCRLKELCSQLKENWQTLASLATKRRQDIESCMLIQGRIEDLSANMLHWLSDLDSSLNQQYPCFGDILTVSSLCEAHENVVMSLEAAADQVDMLTNKTHPMRLPEDKRCILSELYQSVKEKAERRTNILGHALSSAIQFDEEIRSFLNWAYETEAGLRSLRRFPETDDDLQHVTQQLGENLRNISDHQTDFNQLKDMASVILCSCHPDAIESIKECVNLAEIRINEIIGYACELEEKLSNILKNKLAHDKTISELENWLKKIEDYLDGVDIAVKEQLSPQIAEERLDQAELVSQDLKLICGRLETLFASNHTVSQMICRSGTLFNLLKSARKTSSMSQDSISGKVTDLKAKALLKRLHTAVQRSTHYASKLQDWLAFKFGKEEVKNFDFEKWIRRNGPAIKYCRNRLTQYFRRRDQGLTDRVDVDDFIIGLTSVAKLTTGRSQMFLVAELFRDGSRVGDGCMVKYKEFLNAATSLVDQIRRRNRSGSGTLTVGLSPGSGDRIGKEMHDEIRMCSCSEKYQMQPVSEGKYSFGNNKRIHLVRILRSTVMVRVGGGWVSLAEFLAKNDPCRVKGRTNLELRDEFLSNTGIDPHISTSTPSPRSPTLLKTAIWSSDISSDMLNKKVSSQEKCLIHHRKSCEFPIISDSESEKGAKRRVRSGGSSMYRRSTDDLSSNSHL